MTFHYSNASSTWIPMANKNDNTTDVHKDANKLMVTNNSNVSVTGTFTYTPASGVSGVTESFYGLSNGATGSIASGAAKTTYLDLSGKPTGLGSYDYDNAMKIGTVTLTLN